MSKKPGSVRFPSPLRTLTFNGGSIKSDIPLSLTQPVGYGIIWLIVIVGRPVFIIIVFPFYQLYFTVVCGIDIYPASVWHHTTLIKDIY